MACSGTLSAYGALGKVQAACCCRINSDGGICGCKAKFSSLDDSFNPNETVEDVRRLVEQDEVLFQASALGMPTHLAVKAYLHARSLPLLVLSTGNRMGSNPQAEPWVVGWAPNYCSEGRIHAQHILATKPNARTAVLHQNDDTGKDYLDGFKGGRRQAQDDRVRAQLRRCCAHAGFPTAADAGRSPRGVVRPDAPQIRRPGYPPDERAEFGAGALPEQHRCVDWCGAGARRATG